MDALERKWQELEDLLRGYEEDVAQEIIQEARRTYPARRAKEVYRELTGERPTPLAGPLLQVATVLVQKGLAVDYKEALGLLGIGGGEGKAASSPPDEPAGQEEPEEEPFEATTRDQQKWKEAYRAVYGEEPEGEAFEARLKRAILLYDPSKGRRAAFQAVKESEEELQRRTDNLAQWGEEIARLVSPGTSGLPLEEAFLQIGRLSAHVEELSRRLARLEEAVQREATRYGGTKAALQSLHKDLRGLKEEFRVVREAFHGSPNLSPDSRRLEGMVRQAKAEALAEMEERIRYATDLWRGEMEPRLRALETWAQRITEAFRKTLEARERSRGLFGLFGGKE